jgi:hypothetical protein
MVPPHPATKAETKTHATDSDAFMGGIFVRIRVDRNGNRAIRVDAPLRGPKTGALAARDVRLGYCFRNKPRQLSILPANVALGMKTKLLRAYLDTC